MGFARIAYAEHPWQCCCCNCLQLPIRMKCGVCNHHFCSDCRETTFDFDVAKYFAQVKNTTR
ncbi:uncharacterized protein ASCRUDRAFT_75383 [Ascoidea rubescens DSM 1968]|uniref:Uncharacterized protein n=1 Tax=Ascoidea rubescens DSM 1968 TaxID=1344418 RepID=A0A1D2VIK7_9ASCO|nr:hypothetical protein ASCRUDRAFT_75383 [Ascoidea rubescens DSM 1968]ODV61360.1 hypothetical protein ASCRUDRAFT_75383 [Ascoidea rubescens DSM 1968]